MDIKDFKEFENNPRVITDTQFELLKSTLDEFGDLGCIVINEETQEVISGNQRTRTFKEHPEDFLIQVDEEYDKPQKDGTVKRGFIINTMDETRFLFRMVRWDRNTAMKANIAANKVGGFFDYDVLANVFPEDVLLDYGFSEADLDFMPHNKNVNEREKDKDELEHSMTTYLEGNVKQISLFIKGEDYGALMDRVNKVMEEGDLKGGEFKNHTELFLKAFTEYENNRETKKEA